MKKILYFLCSLPIALLAQNHPSQPSTPPDAWHIVADNIDPAKYYGITVANGMIGLVSSPEPMKVKDVVPLLPSVTVAWSAAML